MFLVNQDPASYPTAGRKRKRCSLRSASSAQYGEGRIARTSITEDGSTRPLAERLEPEPFRTQNKVAILNTLAERRGTNEVSGRGCGWCGRHLRGARDVSLRRNMGSPARREPYGDGVAVVAAGVTTCRGAEESSAQDEGRQGNRLTLMRLREMRRGQRERSGNWRADYLETRTVGSEEGG